MIIERPSVGLYWYTDFDPTTAGGVAAPLGQLLIDQTSTDLYYKSGAANTAWTLVGSGGPPPAGTVEVFDEGVSLGNFDGLNFTGAGVTATDLGGGNAGIAIPGTTPVQDEGVAVASFRTMNYTGVGVTVTNLGGSVAGIDVPGGMTVRDEGVALGFFNVMNFVGAGVTATNAGGGVTTVTIPGAAGMAIGGAVTSGTTGSLLYVAAGPVLAQDNANLFWDGTNHRMGLGTTDTTTTTQRLQVAVAAVADAEGIKVIAGGTNTYADMVWFNSAGVQKGGVGYGGTTISTTALRDLNFLYSGGPNYMFYGTAQQFLIGMTSGSAFWEMGLGASAAVSTGSTLRTRYDQTGGAGVGAWQVSINAAAYKGIAITEDTSWGSGQQSAVLFSNTSNRIATDKTNFFWDITNKRLGIGTSTPTYSLEIKASVSGEPVGRLSTTNTAGYAGFEYADTAGTLKAGMGYGNTAVGLTHLQQKIYIYSNTPNDVVFANGTKNEFSFGMTDGSTFLEMANGSSAAVSGANLGRLRYNTTGQKFQVSFNTAAYFDVATYAAALTSGQVQFGNGSNQLAGSANLFWDNTNKRLGIQTASPQYALDIRENLNQAVVWLQNTATTGSSGINYASAGGTAQMQIGFGGSALGTVYLRNVNFMFSGTDTDMVFANSTKVMYQMNMGTTVAAFSLAPGNAAVGIAGLATLIYDNSVGDHLYVAFNGGAKVLII